MRSTLREIKPNTIWINPYCTGKSSRVDSSCLPFRCKARVLQKLCSDSAWITALRCSMGFLQSPWLNAAPRQRPLLRRQHPPATKGSRESPVSLDIRWKNKKNWNPAELRGWGWESWKPNKPWQATATLRQSKGSLASSPVWQGIVGSRSPWSTKRVESELEPGAIFLPK